MISANPEAYEIKPFPVSLLPEPVARFVREASRAIGCDKSMVALPTLTMLAPAVGTSRRALIKHGWAEPCIMWSAIVAQSGTLKSPAQQAALRPVFKRQAKAFERHKEAMQIHELEVEQYESDLTEWKKRNRDPGQRPQKPVPPTVERYVASDITCEALAPMLQGNPRGVLVAVDELTTWLRSFDQYKSGRGNDAARWLSTWNAAPLTVDRKNKDTPTLHVPMAAVSVCGTIQPSVLRDTLGRSLIENGCAARLLLAKPQRSVPKWTDNEIHPDTEAAIDRLYNDLVPRPRLFFGRDRDRADDGKGRFFYHGG